MLLQSAQNALCFSETALKTTGYIPAVAQNVQHGRVFFSSLGHRRLWWRLVHGEKGHLWHFLEAVAGKFQNNCKTPRRRRGGHDKDDNKKKTRRRRWRRYEEDAKKKIKKKTRRRRRRSSNCLFLVFNLSSASVFADVSWSGPSAGRRSSSHTNDAASWICYARLSVRAHYFQFIAGWALSVDSG